MAVAIAVATLIYGSVRNNVARWKSARKHLMDLQSRLLALEREKSEEKRSEIRAGINEIVPDVMKDVMEEMQRTGRRPMTRAQVSAAKLLQSIST